MNAGYASRVAVATFVLERWLLERAAETRTGSGSSVVNVVIVGGGLDALGLWSKQLLHRSSDISEEEPELADGSALQVKVCEVDAMENCLLKRRALVQAGLLRETRGKEGEDLKGQRSEAHHGEVVFKSSPKSSFCIVARGEIALGRVDQKNYHDNEDYTLMGLDLRETCPSSDNDATGAANQSILSKALQHAGLSFSRPTLVLSELVLAYLGQGGADAVLGSVATDLLRGNDRSLFVCLEPVFPPNAERVATACSVEESYAREYGRKFLGKLQSGSSTATSKSAADPGVVLPLVHPLGRDMQDIRARLESCGFTLADVVSTSLGEAAAFVARARRSANAPGFLRAKEPFDEHVALALHLNCYAVICAFSSNSDESDCWLKYICPWRKESAHDSAICIHRIASSLEDHQVRHLYGKIYVHLYSEYSAIHKMVKAALKADLRATSSQQGVHVDTRGESLIRKRFESKGGSFWVARDRATKIIACVGVALRKKRHAAGPGLPLSASEVVDYEIQRLVVDDNYRGRGTAKRLLGTVEKFVKQTQTRIETVGIGFVMTRLWAVTPACLVAANDLYRSVGYKREETFQAGALCMNVYCKSLRL